MRSREATKATEIVEYKNIHKWLNRHHPKEHCSKCGRTYKDRTILDWANVSGTHKRDVKQYIVLCRKCHKDLDKFDTCANGHEYTEKNTYIAPSDTRQCKICRRVAWQKCYDTNQEYRENKIKRDKERKHEQQKQSA